MDKSDELDLSRQETEGERHSPAGRHLDSNRKYYEGDSWAQKNNPGGKWWDKERSEIRNNDYEAIMKHLLWGDEPAENPQSFEDFEGEDELTERMINGPADKDSSVYDKHHMESMPESKALGSEDKIMRKKWLNGELSSDDYKDYKYGLLEDHYKAGHISIDEYNERLRDYDENDGWF